nr:CsgG/HfaB family protein [Rubricoccus marinus]
MEQARSGPPATVSAELLESTPAPSDPVVVAVYRFRDQTGQYRALENSSTFSNVVTQGATSILMRALEASGFFVPIEREGLSNLLNERQIISTTRQQYTGPEGQGLGPLPPLLYAGVLLEGGIIGYDSNVITGGAGARLLGVGGSGEFRQDQITLYLRAVSVQNGRVLKSVHTTKTIVSQKLDGGVFRFVDTKAILETEAGYSTNEPPVLAVTAAIEEAVRALVVEGSRDGLWSFESPEAPQTRRYIEAYDADVVENRRRDSFDRLVSDRSRDGASFAITGGVSQFETDYAEASAQPIGAATLSYPLMTGLSFGARGEAGLLDIAGSAEPFLGAGGVVKARLLPSAQTSPTFTAGAGALSVWGEDSVFAYGTMFGGLESRLSGAVAFQIEAGLTYPFLEGLDTLVNRGSVNDNVWSVQAGFVFYSGR